MRLEDELEKLGIKYSSEIINNSKVIRANGVRVHIYKDRVMICTDKELTFPPTIDSLKYVLEVIKHNERN